MTEKVCGKSLWKKFVKNTKWNSLYGYFVSSLCRKTLWLLYVYVRDFCDGITFLGKVHFCIRKRLYSIYFSAKTLTFTEISVETHKNLSESTKNIATAVNKRSYVKHHKVINNFE